MTAKTQYQFIHFEKIEDGGQKSSYSCHSNKTNDELGRVSWYPRWRQYVFWSGDDTLFSVGCLSDIAEFIKQVTP